MARKKAKYKIGDIVLHTPYLSETQESFEIKSMEYDVTAHSYLYYENLDCSGGFLYEDDIQGLCPPRETIISAAVHYDDGKEYLFQKIYGIKTGFVIGVFRHPMASDILPLNAKFDRSSKEIPLAIGDYKVTQGFMTSLGRFVDRKEAYEIALNAEQITNENGVGCMLFSEDICPKQMYNNKGEKIL